jgi:hypothetical protein
MGHYVSQCLEKKKRKVKQVAVGIVTTLNEGSSQLQTAFSMVSCLSSSNVSSVG